MANRRTAQAPAERKQADTVEVRGDLEKALAETRQQNELAAGLFLAAARDITDVVATLSGLAARLNSAVVRKT